VRDWWQYYDATAYKGKDTPASSEGTMCQRAEVKGRRGQEGGGCSGPGAVRGSDSDLLSPRGLPTFAANSDGCKKPNLS
jgi:hypothetical protein